MTPEGPRPSAAYENDERERREADASRHSPTALGREDDRRRLKAAIAVARGNPRPKRRSRTVNATASDGKIAAYASPPRKLLGNRAVRLSVPRRDREGRVIENCPKASVAMVSRAWCLSCRRLSVGLRDRAPFHGRRFLCRVCGSRPARSSGIRAGAAKRGQNEEKRGHSHRHVISTPPKSVTFH